jgi:universal stress protein A
MNQDYTYHHVLVALDINDDFQPILGKAIAIARRHHAKLSVLHVDINLRDLYTEMVDIDVERVQRKVLADTKNKLDTILAGVDYPLERSMVMCGDLVEEVNQVIDAQSVDLLVCGHHQSFWNLLASAARQLMNTVNCDMLVVPFPTKK